MTPVPTVPALHVRRSWKALFDHPDDAVALARCWAAGFDQRGTPPIRLRPRALGGAAVLCRPGTTDAQVFDDTFVGLYHLPPEPLTEDAVILDLGGNVGYTAAHFAVMHPRARVICVEMDADNAEAARVNLEAFGPRCRVVHAAAWDRDGPIEYGGTEEWGFRVTTLEGQTPTPPGERRRTAPAMSMDTLLRAAGLDGAGLVIDYAKVDIEGAEAAIVMPDAGWLRRVRTIKVEHHEPATREGMARALRAAGFRTRSDDRHPRCTVGVRMHG